MISVLVIIAVIAAVLIAGIVYAARRRKEAYDAIYYVNNYGRSAKTVQYHPINNMTNEELDWLFRLYDEQIKTRYHKVAGGMLVERSSEFQLQVERDLKNRRLHDEQIDELTAALQGVMDRIRRYDSERCAKMEMMVRKLNSLKKIY